MRIKMAREKRKALLRLGYTCNNNCFFCHSRCVGAQRTDLDTQECERRIKLATEAGAEMVVFSGGEPTIRKDIIRLCGYAVEQGLECGVVTNGRMLSYRGFAMNLLEAGVRYVLVSLHGGDRETHNRHVGAAAFDQTVAGLAAVSRLPVQLVVNTVLTDLNALNLRSVFEQIIPFAPLRYKISLPEPRGAVLSNMDLALNPNSAAHAVADFLAACDIPPGVEIGFDGFTPCLLEDYFTLNDDFFTHGFTHVWYPDEDRFSPPDRGDRSYADSCLLCSWYGLCPGIYTEYFVRCPEMRLSPVSGRVSSRIAFEPRSEHPDMGKPCDAPFMSAPHPARRLAMRDEGRIRIYETFERETDAVELRALKTEFEQVYIRRGESEEGLTKLRRLDICEECPRELSCPGVFEAGAGNELREAESGIKRILGRARGRVCVISGGEGPLFSFLNEKLSEGTIEFLVKIDSLAAQRQTEPSGGSNVYKTDFEDFCWGGEPFDSVVLDLTYNSLRDLGASMETLKAVSLSGTIVIIIEDCKRIELSAVEPCDEKMREEDLSRRRNHTAANAAMLLGLAGFRTDDCFEVSRHTSYRWALAARKKASEDS